jgi:hypothetical protein
MTRGRSALHVPAETKESLVGRNSWYIYGGANSSLENHGRKVAINEDAANLGGLSFQLDKMVLQSHGGHGIMSKSRLVEHISIDLPIPRAQRATGSIDQGLVPISTLSYSAAYDINIVALRMRNF